MNSTIKKILKPIYNRTFKPIVRNSIIQLPISLFALFRQVVYVKVNQGKYEYLKKFKDIHKGKRCFIIATGPSLTIEDVNKLKGEVTFSMNSVYKLFKETDWRPTYYGINDYTVFSRLKDELLNQHFDCAFCPDTSGFKWNAPFLHRLPYYPGWCPRFLTPKKLRRVLFSEDISRIIYQDTSVVHFITQIAFYMGFSEIYFLGTDCTAPDSHSSMLNYKNSNQLGTSPENIYEGLMADYEKAKEIAERRGIKIFNATRGGALEKFPRVNLDDVL